MTKHTTHNARKRLGLPWGAPTGTMAQLLNELSPECGQWLYAQTNEGQIALAKVASDYIEDAYLEDMEKQAARDAE